MSKQGARKLEHTSASSRTFPQKRSPDPIAGVASSEREQLKPTKLAVWAGPVSGVATGETVKEIHTDVYVVSAGSTRPILVVMDLEEIPRRGNPLDAPLQRQGYGERSD